MKPKLIAAVSLFTFAVSLANAGLDEWRAAFVRGDYEIAIKELRPLAEQGNAEAQKNLGKMYADGRGVAKDRAEAVKWYRKAADQGHTEAQKVLRDIQ